MSGIQLVTSENYPLHVVMSGDNSPDLVYIRELVKQMVPGRVISRIIPYQYTWDSVSGSLAADPNVAYFARVEGMMLNTYLFGKELFISEDVCSDSPNPVDLENITSTAAADARKAVFFYNKQSLPFHLFNEAYSGVERIAGNGYSACFLIGWRIEFYPN